ncbi:MAG: helix-turn-helix transcriptional regulator [Vulcanimicrobiota bacterium]
MMNGHRIRQLRKERKWTQQELGAKAGVNYHNLPRYESGKLEPGAKTLQRFADAFEVTMEELLGTASSKSPGLRDEELFRLASAIDQMGDDERNAVKKVLHAVVFRHQVQSLGQSA